MAVAEAIARASATLTPKGNKTVKLERKLADEEGDEEDDDCQRPVPSLLSVYPSVCLSVRSSVCL